MTATYTTFDGARRIASGDLDANARAARDAMQQDTRGPVLTFDDASGRIVDIDLRPVSAAAPSEPEPEPEPESETETERAAAAPRGRGRPKLGVVAREVTLLPRHWEWLEAQSGGASTTLRRLVDEARKANAERDAQRAASERAYRVMHALAGDLPGFEEASRALFAHDAAGVARHGAAWPADVLDYVLKGMSDGGQG